LGADPFKDLAAGLTKAFYVGDSRAVGGTTTDVIAVVSDELFMQIWIGADDKLPRRLRATYRGDPMLLRHQVDLSNWKLDPSWRRSLRTVNAPTRRGGLRRGGAGDPGGAWRQEEEAHETDESSFLPCRGRSGTGSMRRGLARANAWGGRTGGFGGFTHDNASAAAPRRYGGTSHTNRSAAPHRAYGLGAVHTTAGGVTTYHPPAYGYGGYAPYYRPVGVPYYHPGCYYDCGAAVAAGAAVGLAAGAGAGAAIARANTIPA
jgi:hypothetical protein